MKMVIIKPILLILLIISLQIALGASALAEPTSRLRVYAELQRTWFLKYKDNNDHYAPKRSPPPPPKSNTPTKPISDDVQFKRSAPPSPYIASA